VNNNIKIAFEVIIILLCSLSVWVITISDSNIIRVINAGLVVYWIYVLIDIMRKNRRS
jgi:hypothetical protein